jgi:hypothetical protein
MAYIHDIWGNDPPMHIADFWRSLPEVVPGERDLSAAEQIELIGKRLFGVGGVNSHSRLPAMLRYLDVGRSPEVFWGCPIGRVTGGRHVVREARRDRSRAASLSIALFHAGRPGLARDAGLLWYMVSLRG